MCVLNNIGTFLVNLHILSTFLYIMTKISNYIA